MLGLAFLRRNSISGSLIFTIGAIVLMTTIAVSVAGYFSARSTIEHEFRDQLAGLSRQAMAQQDTYLAGRMEELRQLVFTELVENPNLSVQDENKILWNYARAFGSSRYTDLSILDLDGKVVASTGSPQFAPSAPWLATLKNAIRPGIVGWTTFTDQATPQLIVYAPLTFVDATAGVATRAAHRGTLIGRLPDTEMAALLRGVPIDASSSLFLMRGDTMVASNAGAGAPQLSARGQAIDASAQQTQNAGNVGLTVLALMNRSAIDAPVRDLAWRSAVVGIVVFLLASLAAVWTARRIARPVRAVATAAHELSRGNLDSSVDVSHLRLAELRDLGSSFNSMAHALRSVIEGIESSSKTIFGAVHNNLDQAISVSSGMEQQASATAQIAAALSEAGAGARAIGDDCARLATSARGGLASIDRLVGIIDTTNSALAQLREWIDRSNVAGKALAQQAIAVADRAREVGHRTDDSSRSASDGLNAVRGVVADIQSVGSSLLDTVERLEHLAQASAKTIQAQVDVIGDMAERSKLLALNAGIEAARAGDTGRGFAVIAGELHRLASGSKSAGDEVKLLVGQVISETQSLVVQAKTASELARGAIERAKNTGATIDTLVLSIDGNAADVRQIGAIAAEQASRTTDIETATEEMRSMALQTAQASRAVGELSREVRGTVEFATSVATQVAQATGEQVETFAVIEQNANDIERATAAAAQAAQVSLDATHRLQTEVEALVARVGGFAKGDARVPISPAPPASLPAGRRPAREGRLARSGAA